MDEVQHITLFDLCSSPALRVLLTSLVTGDTEGQRVVRDTPSTSWQGFSRTGVKTLLPLPATVFSFHDLFIY